MQKSLRRQGMSGVLGFFYQKVPEILRCKAQKQHRQLQIS